MHTCTLYLISTPYCGRGGTERGQRILSPPHLIPSLSLSLYNLYLHLYLHLIQWKWSHIHIQAYTSSSP